jgi:hypothetical protein
MGASVGSTISFGMGFPLHEKEKSRKATIIAASALILKI